MSRLIVLTGCTRGLGRVLADAFIADGHRVAGCGRSAEHVAGLAKRYPTPHRFDVVDVADPDAVARWAETVLGSFGTPDLLVNNAAVMNRPAPLWQQSADEFGALIDVNVKGVVNVIRGFVPAMVAAGRGVIVNLSSGWGRSTSPEVAPYCASKYAVEGLSLALAQELPKGMASVPLSPGVIDTDMLRVAWGDGADQHQKPAEWAKKAAPFILGLGAKDNGKSLSVK